MTFRDIKRAEYESINPADGKVSKKFETLSDGELETKIAIAAKAYEIWRHKGYAERAKIVAKAAAILHAKGDDYARIMTFEMGKRIGEARGEVQ